MAVGAEESQVELTLAVGDGRVEHPALALTHRTRGDPVDPGHNRHLLAVHETGQVGQLAGLQIPAWYEVEQVADGVQVTVLGHGLADGWPTTLPSG